MTDPVTIESPDGVVYELAAALNESEIVTISPHNAPSPPTALGWIGQTPVQLIVHGTFLEASRIEMHTTTASRPELLEAADTLKSLLADNYAVTDEEYALETIRTYAQDLETLRDKITQITEHINMVMEQLLETPPENPTMDELTPYTERIDKSWNQFQTVEELLESLTDSLDSAGVKYSGLDDQTDAYQILDRIETAITKQTDAKRNLASAHVTIREKPPVPKTILNEFNSSLPDAQSELIRLEEDINEICLSLEGADADGTS